MDPTQANSASRPVIALPAEPPLATLQALLSTSVITHLVLALQQASVQPAPSSAASRALVQKDLETTLKTLANLVKLIGEFCDKGRWGTGIDAPRGKAAKRPTRAEVREEQTARELVGRKIGEMLEVSRQQSSTDLCRLPH